jgi:hypothetical protein
MVPLGYDPALFSSAATVPNKSINESASIVVGRFAICQKKPTHQGSVLGKANQPVTPTSFEARSTAGMARALSQGVFNLEVYFEK